MLAERLLRLRRPFLASTAFCLTLSMLPTAARAADDAPAPAAGATDTADQGLTDIVVTAEKRPENLQKTPIAISVMKAEDLSNRHVTSLLDLGDGAIPSLRVAPFFARPSAVIMNIRGIGVLSDSNQPARDQGVGVYVDGVYMGRAQGLGTAMFDVESIEVLKGPQGTLFGRNTEGGAVSITTRKPSGTFAMSTTLGVGNYGSYKAETHLDLPEFHDISIKLDGVISHRDGLVKNPLQGASDFSAYDKRGLHAEALWKITPNFTADYAFDISYDASTSAYVQLVQAGSLPLAPNMPLQPKRASVANVGVPEQPSVGKTHGHRLNLEWQVAPHLTLKSISAYRALTQSQYDGGSEALSVYSPGGQFDRYSLAGFRQNQVSEEIQAVGGTDRLKYAAGALFYEERVQDSAQTPNMMQWNATGTSATVLPVDLNNVSIDRASHVKTDSYGLYAQGTYTPAVAGDILHITGGLRWSDDKKVGQLFTINGTTPVSVTGVVAPLGLNASWSRVDPMVNLAVDASRDVHVYGKWSTGYKSGGANSRSLTYAPFKPETVSIFELGAKTEFWNHRARFNLAAYAGTYKNVQVDFSASYLQYVNGVLQNSNRTTLETTNAPGTGHLRGVEAEVTLNPLAGLTMNLSYAWNHVDIPNTANPYPVVSGGVAVINPNPVKIYPVYTPTQSASGSIDYEVPLQGATLRLHLDGNYDNGFYVNANDPTPNIQPKGDPSFIMNGRLALANIAMAGSGAHLTISAWARNLLNEQHMFYKAYSQYLGMYAMFNDARTYGLEANVKF